MSTKRSPSVEFVRRISPPKGRIRRTPTPHPKKRSRSRSPSPEVQYIKTVKKPAKSPQHTFSPENGVMQYKEIRPRLFLVKRNVSNVTNMFGLFCSASSFNQPLNKWNVSNVKKMSGMFEGANSFNQPLNDWDVSKVTDMRGMFASATSFNHPLHAPWYHEGSESE